MNLGKLLSDLHVLDIHVWVEDKQLRYRAPKGAMNAELKSILAENKQALIALLKKNERETKEFPLSYNQQSLWFLHTLYPDSPAYNVSVAFRVLSDINRNAVQFAFNQIIHEHEALRTTYHVQAGGTGPVQRINAFNEIPVEHIETGTISDRELERRIRAYYEKPFNLETGPVIRLAVFRIRNNEFIFIFVLHHVACDAYSLKILMESFSSHYSSYGDNKSVTDFTAPLNGSYVEFVERQQGLLYDQERRDDFLLFWKKQLKDMPQSINLPRDFQHPPMMQLNGSSYYFYISGSRYNDLVALSRASHASLNAVLVALFQVLLFAVTGQDDIVFGMLSTGRSSEEDQDTCGYYINPLVVRTLSPQGMSFIEYVPQVYETVLELLERREYPFPVLVEEFEKKRDSGKSPVFQVLFNYLNAQSLGMIADLLIPSSENGPILLGGLPIVPYPIQQQEGQFELTFEIIDNGKLLFCNLKHNTDLFTRDTAERICSCFQILLDGVLADPRVTLDNLVESGRLNFSEEKKKQPLPDIVISANYTIELVSDPINFWMDKLCLNYRLQFAPYNQVFQQLLDTASMFHRNTSGVNIICLRLEEWLPLNNGETRPDDGEIEKFRGLQKEFIDAFRHYNSASPITTLVVFSPSSPGIINNPAISGLLDKAEEELFNILNAANAVYVWKSGDVASLYPVADYYEKMGESIGHIPYTRSYFTALGTFLMRKLFVLHHKPCKVIVLDCDNTLWNGIVGEDGVTGLTIDSEKRAFQEFLIRQHDAGMVLCLCSKNNPRDVFEVLEKHPDMLLRKDHITASRINWSLKSENIIELAHELNLGLDSFIFIDDNPVECSEVESRCPGVLAISQPENNIMRLLDHVWIFDKLKVTRDDQIRADFYRSDIKRSRLQSETYSFKDFIEKLGLKITISELRNDEIGRASQMTQRVNQFNLKTIRRDEGTVMKLMQNPSFHAYSVNVSDRFADYGLVGSLAFEIRKSRIIVDTFLLSCRALGKGVEHAMLALVGRFGIDNNIRDIEIEYIPSERNTPIANFLQKNLKEYGSQAGDNTLYVLPAGVASGITFNTDEKIEKADEAGKEKAKSGVLPVVYSDNSRILDIALNYSDIKMIENEVVMREKSRTRASIEKRTAPSSITLSDMEKALTAIWKDLLYHDNFTIDDNFFEIGGKSILIPSIVIRLNKEHGITISIIDVFTFPTIKSLSDRIVGNGPRRDEQKSDNDITRQRQAQNARRMQIKKARGMAHQE